MTRPLARARGPVLMVLAGLLALALVSGGSAAKRKPLSGKIEADGSSTVGPFTQAAAEGFQKKHRGVRVTVGISGTGGGFSRFCRGETNLQNASRPIRLNATEHGICQANGVRYIAFTVANDGITVAVNRSNTWANCLTVEELRKIWDAGSTVDNWRDVRPSFPNVPLRLYGAGTDSGTFDFFTEKINGRSRRSRSDYSASEDDNVLVRGIQGDRGALGYFGLSYYEENKSKLKAVRIDGGNGCVAPSVRTVQNASYKPLSRPLFVYANRADFKRPEIAAFIGYLFNNERAISKKALMVPLTGKQRKKARRQYRQALRQVFGPARR